MILISVRQNKTNAAVIIEGPEGVLISKATAFSICESCEMVDEISDTKLSKYISSFNYKKGMKFKRFNLEFFGLCKKCK